jgi:hypothetical protein
VTETGWTTAIGRYEMKLLADHPQPLYAKPVLADLVAEFPIRLPWHTCGYVFRGVGKGHLNGVE